MIPQALEIVKVPQGVSVAIDQATGLVKVKGKNGELKRTFQHPEIKLSRKGDDIVIAADFPRRQVKALVGTYGSHLRNMVSGAQKDWEYKLKIVFAHFPIKAKAQGETFLIENFLGEKTPRRARLLAGTKVKVGADEVIVSGADLEAVAQTAANIEQATKIRGFDHRVFQDGIYITAKGA